MVFYLMLLFQWQERRCVALIDNEASQSYISPEIVILCELQCSPTLIHLELADGAKVRSTQQTQAVSYVAPKVMASTKDCRQCSINERRQWKLFPFSFCKQTSRTKKGIADIVPVKKKNEKTRQ